MLMLTVDPLSLSFSLYYTHTNDQALSLFPSHIQIIKLFILFNAFFFINKKLKGDICLAKKNQIKKSINACSP